MPLTLSTKNKLHKNGNQELNSDGGSPSHTNRLGSTKSFGSPNPPRIEYFDLVIKIVEAHDLIETDVAGCADPYVSIVCGPSFCSRKTSIKPSTLTPFWNETFEMQITNEDCYLTLEMWDSDKFSGDDFMGKVVIPLPLYPKPIAKWFTLARNAATDVVSGEIFIELCVAKEYFLNCSRWGHALDAEYNDVIRKNRFFTEMKLDKENVLSPRAIFENLLIGGSQQLLLPYSERIELCLKNSVMCVSGYPIYGRVYLTNYRLCFFPEEIFSQPSFIMQQSCVLIPFGVLHRVMRVSDEAMLRTLSCVITVETFDFRIVKIILPLKEHPDHVVSSFYKRIKFRIRNNDLFSPAFDFLEDLELHGITNGWNVFDMENEMLRLNVDMDKYRISEVNHNYEICPSYPARCLVPGGISDNFIKESAKFRSSSRFPAVCWHNPVKQNVMLRGAQPLPGITNVFNICDEAIIAACRSLTPNDTSFIIFDARSAAAAGGNKIAGKGFEDVNRYYGCKLKFMEIGNIHTMRHSIDSVHLLVNATNLNETLWLSELEKTGWLEHIRSLLNAACIIASTMIEKGISCLVHCSDGWDRTSQLTSLAQILMDPYYRTINGFAILIEKEWFAFGHRFRSRNGVPNLPQERSPVFLQWIDCVWQLTRQFPEAFEFNECFLIFIADHLKSGWFGNFLMDNEYERVIGELKVSTFSIWNVLNTSLRLDFSNKAYSNFTPQRIGSFATKSVSEQGYLYPICSLKIISFWGNYYLRHDEIMFRSHFQSEEKEESKVQSKWVMWMPDEASSECLSCSLSFSFFKRRHHCRSCGKLFCLSCIAGHLDLPHLGYSTPQKVCEKCFIQHLETEEVSTVEEVTESYSEVPAQRTVLISHYVHQSAGKGKIRRHSSLRTESPLTKKSALDPADTID